MKKKSQLLNSCRLCTCRITASKILTPHDMVSSEGNFSNKLASSFLFYCIQGPYTTDDPDRLICWPGFCWVGHRLESPSLLLRLINIRQESMSEKIISKINVPSKVFCGNKKICKQFLFKDNTSLNIIIDYIQLFLTKINDIIPSLYKP